MNLLLITFLFVFATKCSAYFELPFWIGCCELSGPNINVSIGTPPQFVVIRINLQGDEAGLKVESTASGWATNITAFNANLSSTWNPIGIKNDTYYNLDTYGNDNFVFTDSNGNEQKLVQKPFDLMDKGYDTRLSLTYSKPNLTNEFLDAVLADQEEKVLVITVDNSPNMGYYGETGKLTFGGTPKECSTVWHKSPALPDYHDYPLNSKWAVQLDKIEVGKFAASSPGKAQFKFDDELFYLSGGTYDQIIKELGYNFDKHATPCNQTKTINYTINGYTITILPEDYMRTTDPDEDGYCYFLGYRGDIDMASDLPIRMYNRYCVMMDYENIAVGFTERLN